MARNHAVTLKELNDIAELAYLQLSDQMVIGRDYANPIDFPNMDAVREPHTHFIKMMLNPDNFWWTCKEILNVDLLPFQVVILQELWNHKFPMLIASRGAGKSFLLAIYSILRALLIPGCRVVVCGAGFRQSKIIYEYGVTIWNNAPLLRDICFHGGQKTGQGPKSSNDRCTITIGESVATFAPVGDGTKIRGLRANTVIADEFASINQDIFERVIGGFGVVSQNPVQSVKDAAKKKTLEAAGISPELIQPKAKYTNQTIISGTAYYDFNHFSDYHKKWRAIIDTAGNIDKLCDIISDDEIPSGFDHKDYSIIRIPYELLPQGFLDEGQVARARATVDIGTFLMEYKAVFSKDSEGFYKRTLVESCVAKDNKPITLPSGDITFKATTKGYHNHRYVYGVDPAILNDNFSIVVLEIHPDHRRVVYCWVSNRKSHRKRLENKLTNEMDFYDYCARKIRDLMKTFPCLRIGMDAQGGGMAVEEALQDTVKLAPGEVRILPTIVKDEPKPTDRDAGDHILELVQFARSDWVREANHGMRKDMEDKTLLFPHFDPACLEEAAFIDTETESIYDSLEDVMQNIEELKDELATIVHTQTSNGTDRWDTPEVKLPGNKKGRLRKDRYSALLIANMIARQILRQRPEFMFDDGMGSPNIQRTGAQSNFIEIGPSWYMDKIKEASPNGNIYGSIRHLAYNDE